MNDLVSTKDFVVILINNLIYTEFLLGIVNPWSWPRQSIITEQGTKEFPSFIPCSIPQGRTMRVPSRPPPRSRPRRRESWGLNPQPPLHWVSLLDAVRVCVPSENVREYVIDWPKRNVRKSFWNPIAVLLQRLKSRLLHPQHLDGIWIGLIHYRLPYAPVSEYPEPWLWKVAGSGIKSTCCFGALKTRQGRPRW